VKSLVECRGRIKVQYELKTVLSDGIEPPHMPRGTLQTASESLESAAQETENRDASDRLADLSDQLGTLATAETGPDHGRLARIQSALNDIESGNGADVTEDIGAADEAINEYRSDLEGV
jgi:hypothetical protein